MENMLIIGNCVVCNETITDEETGYCGDCGGIFCWTDCGGWGPLKHRCDNCGGEEELLALKK